MEIRPREIPGFEGFKFTIEVARNYHLFEMMVGGSVKGKSLPPGDRVIELIDAKGDPVLANVGEWLIFGRPKGQQMQFLGVMAEAVFNEKFEIV